MFILVAATGLELESLLDVAPVSDSWAPLLSGVGPVEAAYNLTAYISRLPILPAGVINFGLVGAFPGTGLDLLDLCLAEEEVLADLGIVYPDRVAPLPSSFAPPRRFVCDPSLVALAGQALTEAAMDVKVGRFVTLSGVSGTEERAVSLRDGCQAIGENMEGAALARVCQGFGVPFLELRCVSNMALDRDKQVWQAAAASRRCGLAAAILVKVLISDH